MSLIDWIMVLLPRLAVLTVGIYAQTYVKSGADFMSAKRSAGRYLLWISSSELQTGALGLPVSRGRLGHAPAINTVGDEHFDFEFVPAPGKK